MLSLSVLKLDSNRSIPYLKKKALRQKFQEEYENKTLMPFSHDTNHSSSLILLMTIESMESSPRPILEA